MGTPKALVRVGGEALWRRQVESLKATGPGELMISAGLDWDPGPGPWTVLRDGSPGIGPLGGIAAALEAMSTDLLLVLAVDMPSMSSAYLAGLIEAAGKTGIVPELDGFFQGLAAVYPRAASSVLGEVLEGTDHSIQHFIRRAMDCGLMVALQVPGKDRHLFRNVNRPSDL
jgi:molybdopterin-guanine dinucleotide biosynthesis protein A